MAHVSNSFKADSISNFTNVCPPGGAHQHREAPADSSGRRGRRRRRPTARRRRRAAHRLRRRQGRSIDDGRGDHPFHRRYVSWHTLSLVLCSIADVAFNGSYLSGCLAESHMIFIVNGTWKLKWI